MRISVPLLFLAMGLGSFGWLAASYHFGKPVVLIVVPPFLRVVLVGVGCGVAIFTFIYWLFMEMKHR